MLVSSPPVCVPACARACARVCVRVFFRFRVFSPFFGGYADLKELRPDSNEVNLRAVGTLRRESGARARGERDASAPRVFA